MKRAVVFALAAVFCAAAAAADGKKDAKTALLIANGDYGRDMGALTQPVAEAAELKTALESIGFRVTLIQNENLDGMRRALKTFREQTDRNGGIAFFHYGGHAVQVGGANYLIPLGASLEEESDVSYRCLKVDELMQSMKGDANVVVLDSCRNNPFALSRHRGADTRGLAAVGIKPKNSIIVYAASEGHTAQDGVFTPILTRRITEKNKNIYDVLREVRGDVFSATGGKQKPGSYDELFSALYLAGVDTAVQTAAQAPQALPEPAAQESLAYAKPAAVQGASRSNMADKTYTVNGVRFTMKPIAAVRDAVLGDNSQEHNKEHTVSLSAYYIGETEVTQELWQAVMDENPSFFDNTRYKTWKFGSMNIHVDTKIADGELQKKRPVEQVGWFDCVIFCNELTAQVMGEEECVYTVKGTSVTADLSKRGFRLPTEAEWEYAAMGGRPYRWAGTNNEDQLKNYAWYKENSRDKTHEVGTKKANKYGIYDMTGNVAEWCWDWYSEETPAGNQTDPQGASSGSYRVVRGGSVVFLDSAKNITLSFRPESPRPEFRLQYLGLRLACRP